MRYRKLTSTGDYTFGRAAQNFYVNQPEAVAQAIQTRLKLATGEWFLDNTEGTPYKELILGVNKQTTADPAIKARILDTQGVVSLDQYASFYDPNVRSLTVTSTVTTQYGTTTINTGAL